MKKFIERIYQCIPYGKGGETEEDENDSDLNQEIANTARSMGRLIQNLQDVTVYNSHEDIGTFRNSMIIPNKIVLSALTRWLLNKENNLYVVTEIGAFFNEKSTKIKKILLGNYDEELKSVGLIEEEVFIDDIKKAKEKVKKTIEYFSQNESPTNVEYSTVSLDKKKYHFTLWKDEENQKVFGITFNRLDRQAGTTFYWIMLDLTDENDKSQFEALMKYMERRVTKGKGGQGGRRNKRRKKYKERKKWRNVAFKHTSFRRF